MGVGGETSRDREMAGATEGKEGKSGRDNAAVPVERRRPGARADSAPADGRKEAQALGTGEEVVGLPAAAVHDNESDFIGG